MNAFIRFVAMLSRLCGLAAGIMLVISVLVVCQMVVLRYVLVESSIWQTEFVTYLLLSATFIGAPYLLLTKRACQCRSGTHLPGAKGTLCARAGRLYFVITILRPDCLAGF